MELLCKGGAAVDAEDRAKTTPLFAACKFNEQLTAKILLEHGANPNHQRFNYDTPLHLAASENSEACLALLVGFGASVDIRNRQGKVPS